MQKIKKIIFVAGLHGNEKMPVRALTENNIPFVLGNPKACEKNIRFIERDINASFGLSGKEYECIRAEEILNEINEDEFVIDFHTTTNEAQPFVIIIDEKMVPLAKQTGVERVVFMRYNIKKGHALINYRKGISIEVGTHQDQRSYQTTMNIVKNVLNQEKHSVVLYEVYDEIRKSGNYENFQEHKDGFIPILAKEPEYEREGLFGLKARKLK